MGAAYKKKIKIMWLIIYNLQYIQKNISKNIQHPLA